MSGFTVREGAGVVRFAVHVQPRASRSEIVGLHGDALKVRLAAPPVDGAANDALVVLLAEALAVGRRAVRIVSGASSRAKTVEIEGTSASAVMRLVRNHVSTHGGSRAPRPRPAVPDKTGDASWRTPECIAHHFAAARCTFG